MINSEESKKLKKIKEPPKEGKKPIQDPPFPFQGDTSDGSDNPCTPTHEKELFPQQEGPDEDLCLRPNPFEKVPLVKPKKSES